MHAKGKEEKNTISRREFLGGIAAIGAATALAPACLSAEDKENAEKTENKADYYPPSEHGLSGAHPGDFDTAHVLAWKGEGNSGELTAEPEEYDLVIVGAGISGLSAAHYYRQKVNKNAKILILDNHSDFGGHATRNECNIDGKTYITYGGNQSLVSPSNWSKETSDLIKDLGINLASFETAYQTSFFKENNLGLGVFFDAATFGNNALLKSGLPCGYETVQYALHFMPGLVPAPEFTEQLEKTPLTAEQKAKLQELKNGSPKAEAYFDGKEGEERFYSGNYVDFLKDVYGIEDRSLIKLLSMMMAYDAALGGTMITFPAAIEAKMMGMPPAEFFIKKYGYQPWGEKDPFIHHFPDGCGSIARLLVKKLIPDIADFETPEQCITAKFDYSKLDRKDNNVRIRLQSTAILVDNKDNGTVVRYLKKGSYLSRGDLYEVRAKHTIMACWHIMAGRMIPSLPESQKNALKADIKLPLVWAQVFLRNAKALKNSGVAISYCPGAYFQSIQCDFPVKMGEYQPDKSADAPISLLMVRMPCPPFARKSIPDLVKMGLCDMLSKSLAFYEKKIKEQLVAMYGPYGFDAEKDIAGITLNRWPHGYLWTDAKDDKGNPAYIEASKQHGRIVFACSDSAGNAYLDNSVDMAFRSVEEIAQL